MLKRIEAVVFDLGGTLIEYAGQFSSWPDLELPGLSAAHAYLRERGIPMPEFERFSIVAFDLLPRRWRLATSGIKNLTVPSLLSEILGNFGVEGLDEFILVAASECYEQAVCAHATPIPHSRQVVAKLKASGYKLGLISNTMFSTQAHLSDLVRFELADFFETMLFSAEANMWKPNVESFHHVLAELDVKPDRALFVGDDPAADVVGGRRAGMYVVHFLSSDRFPSPDGVTPDATIHDLTELPQLLAKLNG